MISKKFRPLNIFPCDAYRLDQQKNSGYILFYTAEDINNKDAYTKLIDSGMHSVNNFFGASYNKEFNVFVHPNRNSLDSAWQKDWNMPAVKSECWMVTGGISNKMDMISPKTRDKEACEHHYAEREKTQQLITHELVHVFHAQLSSSPDFSDTEGIDWFVEGLATYASGQLDSLRLKEIKNAIIENNVPASLDSFWTGNFRYGLSGSIVLFIEHKWGRNTLRKLLVFNKKPAILSTLKVQETELLGEWKTYIQKL